MTTHLAAAACLAIAGAALTGWGVGLPSLAGWLPGRIAMNPLTAMCLLLLGLALGLLRREEVPVGQRRIAAVPAGIVFCAAGLRLWGGLLPEVDFAIDRRLFGELLGSNRMALDTAWALALSSVALLTLDLELGEHRRPAQFFAIAAGLLGTFTAAGHLFSATLNDGSGRVPMALNTAVAIVLLSLGILCARPERGLLIPVSSETPAGRMLRRLLPAIAAVPLLLAWLRLLGERAGLYEHSFGVALTSTLTLAVMLGVVWWTGLQLYHADRQRQVVEAARQQSARELRDLYEHAPCGYHSLGPDGTILRMNATELDWLGYREEEVIGRLRFTDLVVPASRSQFESNFPRFREQGWVRDLEFNMVRKDGTQFPVSVSATAMVNEAGEYVMSRSVVVDLTDRRRASQALADRARIASLTAQVAVALSESEETREMLRRCAEMALQHLPADRAEIWIYEPGTDFLVLQACEGWPLGETQERRIARGEGEVGRVAATAALYRSRLEPEAEWALQPEGGAPPGHCEFAGAPLVVDRQVLGVLTLYSREPIADTTCEELVALAKQVALGLERKQVAEAYRMAAATAEAANRAKTEFLASMSHELRTPLNAIIGFSELLTEQIFGPLNERQYEYAESIHTSGKHLLQLINDILDLAKVEAGRLELELEPIELRTALVDVEHLISGLARKKKLTVALRVAEDCPAIRADRGKFKQILFNLLSNALKFTPPGGEIRIEADRVPGDAGGPGSVAVSVTDTGIGLRPEDLERVFGQFVQVDASLSRRHEGTGLGLALTRKLVELHGGTISAASPGPMQGSTFTIVFPCREVVLESPAAPDLPANCQIRRANRGSGPLVLVVDDDRSTNELLAQYLLEGGYSVVQAYHGKQALQLAQELSPHAITLDIRMPDMDGWNVLSVLKSSPSTRSIPTVVVSVTEDRKIGLALGASEWLVLPVDRRGLLDTLNRVGAVAGQQVRRILIVDDDPAAIRILSDLLEAEGFAPITAVGGEEGLRLARAALPDAVILDLMMPGTSGFDVARQLRALPETSDLPVIVFTAMELTPYDRQQLALQAQAVVAKPAWSTLLDELRRASPAGAAPADQEDV